jgi:hypothetical protein
MPSFTKCFHWSPSTCFQNAFIADPEKALLDLIYLEPGEVTLDYLHDIRLVDDMIDSYWTLTRADYLWFRHGSGDVVN